MTIAVAVAALFASLVALSFHARPIKRFLERNGVPLTLIISIVIGVGSIVECAYDVGLLVPPMI